MRKQLYYFMLCLGLMVGTTVLVACSNDEDEDTSDLSKNLVGVWEQDGDDDIMVLTADGKMMWYEEPEEYPQNPDFQLKWTIKDGNWLYVTFVMAYNQDEDEEDEEDQEEELWWTLQLQSSTKDKIVWKNYSHDHDDFEDENGTYRLWTWTRYNKK